MRRQIKGLVATAAAVGVMAGSLIGGASVAQAAVGDTTNYLLGSGETTLTLRTSLRDQMDCCGRGRTTNLSF